MNIIAWIVIGGLAGWIASMIMGANHQMGVVANVVVGIIGAFIGGFVMETLTGDDAVSGFNLTSLVVATLGAVILLAVVRAFRRGSHDSR